MQRLTTLSDNALLDQLQGIARSHRRVTAELILHLDEVDARRLHVEKGFPSLFSYCVELLHFSEDEACRRIETARLARRFPAIYSLLETGTVSLTVLGLLKPHLTCDNHTELLAGVSGSSVRHAKEWLAARFPRPDVPWSIRKRPESQAIASARIAAGGVPVSARVAAGGVPVSARVAARVAPVSARIATDASFVPTKNASDTCSCQSPSARNGSSTVRVEPRPRDSSVAPPTVERARVEPLSQDRFLVKFTAGRALSEKLELASDLMRHANPSGELAVLLERAVDLLIAELERKKQGRTSRPQRKPRPAKSTHVTRATRRKVVGQEGWRCSFVAEDGRRCGARGFLEFDHKTPKGRGGGPEAKNLRILCRAHNRWAAERVYGKAYMARAISDSRCLARDAPTPLSSAGKAPRGGGR